MRTIWGKEGGREGGGGSWLGPPLQPASFPCPWRLAYFAPNSPNWILVAAVTASQSRTIDLLKSHLPEVGALHKGHEVASYPSPILPHQDHQTPSKSTQPARAHLWQTAPSPQRGQTLWNGRLSGLGEFELPCPRLPPSQQSGMFSGRKVFGPTGKNLGF